MYWITPESCVLIIDVLQNDVKVVKDSRHFFILYAKIFKKNSDEVYVEIFFVSSEWWIVLMEAN